MMGQSGASTTNWSWPVTTPTTTSNSLPIEIEKSARRVELTGQLAALEAYLILKAKAGDRNAVMLAAAELIAIEAHLDELSRT